MIYDVIGVGFGPSNIAVAISMQERGYEGNTVFLEKAPSARWQDEMLLDGSDIQNNPIRDLITPVNPQSRYGFINYLFSTNQLLQYLNVGMHYPLRKLYAKYVEWVGNQFSNVRYGEAVTDISLRNIDGDLLWEVRSSSSQVYVGKSLVFATGRNLNIPEALSGSRFIQHLTSYGSAVRRLPEGASVAVLGASQSAVELLLDLHGKGCKRVHGIHRSFSYRLKDTSQFSDEVYFPDFIDYYHGLSADKRAQLDRQVRQTNYSAADGDVISSLYAKSYEDSLDGKERLKFHRNTEIVGYEDGEQSLTLHLRDIYTQKTSSITVDLLVLATGFLDVGRDGRDGLPKLLQKLGDVFEWDGSYLNVLRDYKVKCINGQYPPLYMNGLCESSHGLGDAGSFSLLSYRARDIVMSLEKSEVALNNV